MFYDDVPDSVLPEVIERNPSDEQKITSDWAYKKRGLFFESSHRFSLTHLLLNGY